MVCGCFVCVLPLSGFVGVEFGRCCLLITIACCLWGVWMLSLRGFVIMGLGLVALRYYLLVVLFAGFGVLVLFRF